MWFLLWNEINWHQPMKKKRAEEEEEEGDNSMEREMQTAANWLVTRRNVCETESTASTTNQTLESQRAIRNRLYFHIFKKHKIQVSFFHLLWVTCKHTCWRQMRAHSKTTKYFHRNMIETVVLVSIIAIINYLIIYLFHEIPNKNIIKIDWHFFRLLFEKDYLAFVRT